MRRTFSTIAFFLVAGNLFAQHKSLLQYVDPYVGTAPSTTLSAAKHGGGTELQANTIPEVCVPFGMTQWVPQSSSSP